MRSTLEAIDSASRLAILPTYRLRRLLSWSMKRPSFYLITVLDGCSRYIVHHELRESMTELDVAIVCQAALEKHPGVKPRIISDNGPQFIANDFKAFVRHSGMTHVRTSPYYPQSNGKLERWHGSLKTETIRPNCPRDAEEAIKVIAAYVRR